MHILKAISRGTNRAVLVAAPRRWLSIHEYLSMDLLAKYGVRVPFGLVATSRTQAETIAKEYFQGGKKDLVIKAQVLAGGRGKGVFDNGFKGGVHIVSNVEEACSVVNKMLGHFLITKQTSASGRPCDRVYLVEKMTPKHEYYFAVLLDRKTKSPLLVGSKQGGMDIEAVAARDPSAIVSLPIDIGQGLSEKDAQDFARKIGFSSAAIPNAAAIMSHIYQLFVEKDVLLAEINPLVELKSGDVACLDAKLNFDDNADFRQQDIMALRDLKQEDEREVMASEYKLNYIGLDGTIGCLVNGAGLAMATMDIIKLHGGQPANFLDVGGSATTQQVCEAFKILTSDSRVNAILVNIFGGIMRCDIIAEGVIEAASKLDLKVPLVVRLQGTRVHEAKELIAKSNMKIFACDDLTNAAIKSVALSQIMSAANKAHIHVAFPMTKTGHE